MHYTLDYRQHKSLAHPGVDRETNSEHGGELYLQYPFKGNGKNWIFRLYSLFKVLYRLGS